MARVLIIDDDPSIRMVLEYCLGQAGHAVMSAPDGEAGVRLAKESAIDLVLSDIQMPGMTGLAVCEALKRDPASARLPVMLMTGSPGRETSLDAEKVGAVEVVPKPLDFRALCASVSRWASALGGHGLAPCH